MDFNKLTTIKQAFQVNYQYELHFTSSVFQAENSLFRRIIENYAPTRPVKCLFIIDDKVSQLHPELVSQIKAYCKENENQLQFTTALVVPGGEIAKKEPNHTQTILAAINDFAICRHSFVVAIGGGALIDMVGYAATIAHRGVKLIRIPTTVLAQNDAAVGVKNSINAFGKKNFLGTFSLPYAIINDLDFLETLEQRDWISGVAEAIKVALIKDKTFFESIANSATQLAARKLEPMARLIHRCAALHMEHISKGGDPFESGSSRPLDFGHWAAHKLEYMTNYRLRHGEAVAIGMAIDITYACFINLLSKEEKDQIIQVLETIGFDLRIPIEQFQIKELLEGIEEFREHLGGELTITLINAIGTKVDVHQIDYPVMEKAIAAFIN
ncbi:3-dehydroquinate synthase [Croceivirga radicis]|uniref:3-dehydroquinate synthase n=1 Tax=Croceivirga radicis TaxID=1929488 RepID=A0A1V6LR35_9FLAO|nr:3-dehydroquinate synthase [Croceivirga radicis]OQD42670.1 3-dehydroquinate synthase [Croceivirga radicis]